MDLVGGAEERRATESKLHVSYGAKSVDQGVMSCINENIFYELFIKYLKNKKIFRIYLILVVPSS